MLLKHTQTKTGTNDPPEKRQSSLDLQRLPAGQDSLQSREAFLSTVPETQYRLRLQHVETIGATG